MPITKMPYVWMNGEQVPFEDAKIHVLTHALHYGYGVFEGIRAYETPRGSAVFRLEDHIDRFFASAKILMIEIPFFAARARTKFAS
jgi:branched-chain amino acid aminotransferase